MGQGASVFRSSHTAGPARAYVESEAIGSRSDNARDRSDLYREPPNIVLSHEGDSDTAGTAKIRCQKCTLIWKVRCGTTAFTCASCGARVMVALKAVAAQASGQIQKHVAAARAELQAIMEQQAAVTQSLWEQVEEELNLAKALWASMAEASGGAAAGHAYVLLSEATAARDGAQVAEAMAHASQAGLPEPTPTFNELLARLRQEEDLEVLWRCFMRALAAEDAIDLQFWCQEALSQGLHVPADLVAAVSALDGAGRARLAELEYSATVSARATQMAEVGDAEGLHRLVSEANALGGDVSAAQAALASLGVSADSAADASSAGFAATPQTAPDKGQCTPRKSEGSRSASASLGPEAEQMRQWSVARLRQELAQLGLDTGGLCEKEELVHVLLAARASRKTSCPSAAAPATSAASTAAASSATPSASGPGRPGSAGSAPAETPNGTADAGGTGWGPEMLEQTQGVWWRSNGTSMTVSGYTITWEDGICAKLHPAGPDKFFINLAGQRYDARLAGGKLCWSDGDIWTRSPPPQRPKPPPPGPGRPSGPTQPPAQPARKKGPMTRAEALACLSLTREPTEEELRKAYKQAALRWHPDRRQNHDCAEEAKEKFQEVRAAFELLQVPFMRPKGRG